MERETREYLPDRGVMTPKQASRPLVLFLLVPLLVLTLAMQPALAEELEGDPPSTTAESEPVPTATAQPTEVPPPPPPTATPLPTPTPTDPIPTATATALASPTPTATLESTLTATLEPTATATSTEVPIREPELDCEGLIEREVQVGSIVQIECEVTLYDSRADALIEIEPPAGWAVRMGEGDWKQEKLKLDAFELRSGEVASKYEFEIDLWVPVADNVRGKVELKIFGTPNEPIDRLEINYTTFVPADWALRCASGAPAVEIGTSALITCELPFDAWALRDQHPAAHYRAGSGATGVVALTARTFSLVVEAPCSMYADVLPVSIAVQVADGLDFSSQLEVPIDRAALNVTPTLTWSDIEFSDAQWVDLAWTPAEATVLLTIEAPSSPCGDASWSVVGSVSSYSNGEIKLDIPVMYQEIQSSFSNIVMSPSGAITPNASSLVASGTGSGTVRLYLSITISGIAPAGTYVGTIEFDLLMGP